jgi:hypothetical protein
MGNARIARRRDIDRQAQVVIMRIASCLLDEHEDLLQQTLRVLLGESFGPAE